ncbi:unnamed protein product [Acanthoscelides obtectus]|uniref:SAP domain-containing protein n=1 Tax=Acanthoscelides obtectus TaxID=200917 RepID=A0A9P0QCH4_ACAOB|nr:unnamed protein product [Acanthoscelides obtectus]CAH2017178.1 unnamed protein product [Acanthoscelides obtectus]CAK1647751.1 hypothetical protein AOBTE_LOCUS15379 [Acanthoscelides obtectus]CAK1684704.1 hypothetical protein AOBTE_LOCUS35050 [Acanthoscelides obtectus]
MVRLVELKISDLKRELEERECDTAGKKAELQERLRQALIEEGEDRDIFIFTGAGDIALMLQNLSSKLENKLVENCANLEGKLLELHESTAKLEKKFLENTANLKKELEERNFGGQNSRSARQVCRFRRQYYRRTTAWTSVGKIK